MLKLNQGHTVMMEGVAVGAEQNLGVGSKTFGGGC